jgi:hypothetical protein
MRPLRSPAVLSGEAVRNDGKPGGDARQPPIGNNLGQDGPRKARPGADVPDLSQTERNKTTANEPGQTKPVRVARREALPHPREGMRLFNDDGSATWRAIPSHPEGDPSHPGGTRKTGLPGAPAKNTGDGAWAWLIVLPAFFKRHLPATSVTVLQQF